MALNTLPLLGKKRREVAMALDTLALLENDGEVVMALDTLTLPGI